MEALTRLVTESLARHGFDRPVDYRRLQWSHWFRCESHHSLLIVPSKPGVFALAEEVMDFATPGIREGHDFSSAIGHPLQTSASVRRAVEERPISAASDAQNEAALAAVASDAAKQGPKPTRMLAVAQFFDDEDMAFVLDRMLSQKNPMQARLGSGRYFIRFVVVEDPAQRRSICNALNQWILSSAEKATGIGTHFASSLELTPEPQNSIRTHQFDSNTGKNQKQSAEGKAATAPPLNSAVATTIHCSSSFPSGF